MIKEYTGRTIRLIFGLVLYGLGSYMSIQANVGLAPWDAFSMGISYKTGIMYGNVVVYTGFLIITTLPPGTLAKLLSHLTCEADDSRLIFRQEVQGVLPAH